MKKTLYFAFYLAVTAMLVTAVAYFAYSKTNPTIVQNRIDKINRTIELLYSAEDGYSRSEQEENAYREKNYDLISAVYEVLDSDQELYAVIYDMSAQGKNGLIEALIAVDPYNDTVLAVTYYNHSETPNIGERHTRDEAIATLVGQNVSDVTVDVIVGATTTWGAIDSMFSELETHYSQEEVHIDG